MDKKLAFFAYPAAPAQLSEVIQIASSKANRIGTHFKLQPWTENDIAGRPLIEPILAKISEGELLIADVTMLNFNVTYEIGFAIGSGKRAFLTKNASFSSEGEKVARVGIFDTLGYESYENSNDLCDLLIGEIDTTPLTTNYPLDNKAPVYILETPRQSDAMLHIVSRTKKARLQFRSFSPVEGIRLAAADAVKHVASSHGVIIPLLSKHMADADIHNIRAAFVAGLAHGLGKATLILQDGEGPVPIDVRDFAKRYNSLLDIDESINEFALDTVQAMQAEEQINLPLQNDLARMSIGDPMAENEFQTLENYYVETDEYGRALRGEVNLVVGRKGSGKTALFSQVRNAQRRDRQNIVVDLKPEGYQLIKLKEEVFDYLSDGAKAHLITAFWEYLLYLEVAYKILEKDADRHLRDHEIYPHYKALQEQYVAAPNAILGDFSERLLELSNFLSQEYRRRHKATSGQRITTDEVTELVHSHNIRALREALSKYLNFKKSVWLLFDNLDKGWSVPGPSHTDILILRCLIDASRKVQREMQREGHDFHSIVFIRNDVYQLLMSDSADFGKEMRVSLDWSDHALLREVLRRRLVQNNYPSEARFEQIWSRLCITHYKTEETSQYLIDRTLMRPRNLIKIFNHCKGFAVNFGHSRIEPDDLQKGLKSYSHDLIIEADQELCNIDPAAEGLLYTFTGEHWRFTRDELHMLIEEHGTPGDRVDKIISFLLYFGFFGIQYGQGEPAYLYDFGYDMKQMEAVIKKHQNTVEYIINPAFWPALKVGPDVGKDRH